MNQKSTKLSFYAIIILVVVALIVTLILSRQGKINASGQFDNLATHSIPFKLGDNELQLTKSLDLSGRIIGLNGSLITLEEAKRREVIEGVFDKSGKELDKIHLISAKQPFIIKVKDINASPALFF